MIHVRQTEEHDRDQVVAFMNDLWPDCSREEAVKTFHRALSVESQSIFVVGSKKGLHGFSLVSVRNEFVEGADEGPVGYLEGIFVQKKYRLRGLGRSLQEACEAWCREHGCQQMASDAEIENKLSIEFHQRSGFSETNRIVTFIKNLR